MKRKVLKYIEDNNLEVDGMIKVVDLEKVTKHFKIPMIDVMYYLRTRWG